ncbi:hypothetical protein AOLI_G00102930 [Acnodon oligacanthus]
MQVWAYSGKHQNLESKHPGPAANGLLPPRTENRAPTTRCQVADSKTWEGLKPEGAQVCRVALRRQRREEEAAALRRRETRIRGRRKDWSPVANFLLLLVSTFLLSLPA